MTDIILLQPPVLKASEPPLALGVLCAALGNSGHSVAAIDANIEAYLYLLDGERLEAQAGTNLSTATRRALRHRDASLALVRSAAAEKSFARYSTAVRYLNKLLSLWCGDSSAERLTLGDYQHAEYSIFDPEDIASFAQGKVQTLFHDYFHDSLLPQITRQKPTMIAISINYLHQVLPAFELAGLLRERLPAVTLVAGGGLISSWQDQLRNHKLRLPPFDHLIFGPGERPLARLAAGESTDYILADASELGFVPDYSFAQLNRYFSPQPVLPLSTSRGCYWQRCQFCPEAAAPIHPYTSFPAEELADVLLQQSSEHNVRHFHLTDNAIPVSILRGLARRRKELEGLSWFGFVRFEPQLEDADFVSQLAQGGCRMLQLGLESGSQNVLDRLGKGVQLNTAARILTSLYAVGIATYVYIMLGTPGETLADAELTLAFLETHADKISFLNLSIMNLPRKSTLLDDPKQHGIATSSLPSENDPLGLYRQFETLGEWDRSAARRFLDQRILGSKTIQEIVRRTPPLFTSNHAFFFLKRS